MQIGLVESDRIALQALLPAEASHLLAIYGINARVKRELIFQLTPTDRLLYLGSQWVLLMTNIGKEEVSSRYSQLLMRSQIVTEVVTASSIKEEMISSNPSPYASKEQKLLEVISLYKDIGITARDIHDRHPELGFTQAFIRRTLSRLYAQDRVFIINHPHYVGNQERRLYTYFTNKHDRDAALNRIRMGSTRLNLGI